MLRNSCVVLSSHLSRGIIVLWHGQVHYCATESQLSFILICTSHHMKQMALWNASYNFFNDSLSKLGPRINLIKYGYPELVGEKKTQNPKLEINFARDIKNIALAIFRIFATLMWL